MRIPKTTKLKVDLSKPVEVQAEEIPPVTDDDCFGNEWDLTATECRQCADKEVCGILFKHRMKKRIKEVENETMAGKFLDTQTMDFDWEKIVQQHSDKPVKQLLEACMNKGNISDIEAVKEQLKRMIKGGIFKVENGLVKI